MQSQQLAQDWLWKLPSIKARAEGEETFTFANKQAFSSHLIATMATEPHFFSSAQHFIFTKKHSITKIKEPSLWTELLECNIWVSAFVFTIKNIFKISSILDHKHFFFSACTVGNWGYLTLLWRAGYIFCYYPSICYLYEN